MSTKEKTCFVIMPISDHIEYSVGHFSRVYEYIIKPACKKAGFKPIRADEIQSTNYIALDIVKTILEADMAICDLSSRNPNVLYELGIRQAFDLPVTLIKDSKTQRIFDIQGFRDVEYQEDLRVDSIEGCVDSIAEYLKNTFENKEVEVNSLVKLLGIEPAKQLKKREINLETQLILEAIRNIDSKISSSETFDRPNDLNYKNDKILTVDEIKALGAGGIVYHEKFGKGRILDIEDNSKLVVVVIKFNLETRRLAAKYAHLKRVESIEV